MRKHSMLGSILQAVFGEAGGLVAVALFLIMLLVWADIAVRGSP